MGWLAKERWGVPLVHSMHTMAKVKNSLLAEGDVPEPQIRVIGESQVVAAADRLVANTDDEAHQLVDLYDADPARVTVVTPGVDLDRFVPGSRLAARVRLGLPHDAVVLTFVGRIQPLKAPDVLVRAAAELLERRPDLRHRLVIHVVGGPSGTGLAHPTYLADLAADLDIVDRLRLRPPVEQELLPEVYRASDLVIVPSYNESFGLVALEAQACGIPVVAARVGGLPTAVIDGESGVLVDGHDPVEWARVIDSLVTDAPRRKLLGEGAALNARGFGWATTAARTVEVYRAATSALASDQAVAGASLG